MPMIRTLRSPSSPIRSFKLRLVDVEAGDVENHRPAEEEPGRAGRQVVEAGEPVVEGQFGRQDDRQERASLEADRAGIR